jgi:hypothetical protein
MSLHRQSSMEVLRTTEYWYNYKYLSMYFNVPRYLCILLRAEIPNAETSVYKPIKLSDHYPSKTGWCRSDTFMRDFEIASNITPFSNNVQPILERSYLDSFPEVEIENTAYGVRKPTLNTHMQPFAGFMHRSRCLGYKIATYACLTNDRFPIRTIRGT